LLREVTLSDPINLITTVIDTSTHSLIQSSQVSVDVDHFFCNPGLLLGINVIKT